MTLGIRPRKGLTALREQARLAICQLRDSVEVSVVQVPLPSTDESLDENRGAPLPKPGPSGQNLGHARANGKTGLPQSAPIALTGPPADLPPRTPLWGQYLRVPGWRQFGIFGTAAALNILTSPGTGVPSSLDLNRSCGWLFSQFRPDQLQLNYESGYDLNIYRLAVTIEALRRYEDSQGVSHTQSDELVAYLWAAATPEGWDDCVCPKHRDARERDMRPLQSHILPTSFALAAVTTHPLEQDKARHALRLLRIQSDGVHARVQAYRRREENAPTLNRLLVETSLTALAIARIRRTSTPVAEDQDKVKWSRTERELGQLWRERYRKRRIIEDVLVHTFVIHEGDVGIMPSPTAGKGASSKYVQFPVEPIALTAMLEGTLPPRTISQVCNVLREFIRSAESGGFRSRMANQIATADQPWVAQVFRRFSEIDPADYGMKQILGSELVELIRAPSRAQIATLAFSLAVAGAALISRPGGTISSVPGWELIASGQLCIFIGGGLLLPVISSWIQAE